MFRKKLDPQLDIELLGVPENTYNIRLSGLTPGVLYTVKVHAILHNEAVREIASCTFHAESDDVIIAFPSREAIPMASMLRLTVRCEGSPLMVCRYEKAPDSAEWRLTIKSRPIKYGMTRRFWVLLAIFAAAETACLAFAILFLSTGNTAGHKCSLWFAMVIFVIGVAMLHVEAISPHW